MTDPESIADSPIQPGKWYREHTPKQLVIECERRGILVPSYHLEDRDWLVRSLQEYDKHMGNGSALSGSTTARVRLEVVWRGNKVEHKTEVPAELANHYKMDKAIWDATVSVRRALVRQQYPHLAEGEGRRVEFRNEFEAFGAIRSYLGQHPESRFELVPPDRQMPNQWRAYFKDSSRVVGEFPFEIEMNPPVGIGSTDYIAIENLLRFTEGREPIDG